MQLAIELVGEGIIKGIKETHLERSAYGVDARVCGCGIRPG